MLQDAGYSLLGMVVVGAALAALAVLLGRSRDAFLAGLVAAAIAYLIALPTGLIINAATGGHPPRLILPFIDPLIEETLRIFFVIAMLEFYKKAVRVVGASVAFGFGYALFESSAKLMDSLILFWAHLGFSLQTLAILSSPTIVFLLHLTLSFAAIALLRRGWPLLAVWTVVFAAHAAHNATVFWLPLPTDWATLIQSNLVRTGVFALLIVLLLRLLGTEPKPHLQTPSAG